MSHPMLCNHCGRRIVRTEPGYYMHIRARLGAV